MFTLLQFQGFINSDQCLDSRLNLYQNEYLHFERIVFVLVKSFKLVLFCRKLKTTVQYLEYFCIKA